MSLEGQKFGKITSFKFVEVKNLHVLRISSVSIENLHKNEKNLTTKELVLSNISIVLFIFIFFFFFLTKEQTF